MQDVSKGQVLPPATKTVEVNMYLTPTAMRLAALAGVPTQNKVISSKPPEIIEQSPSTALTQYSG